jgi:hypothetical protein
MSKKRKKGRKYMDNKDRAARKAAMDITVEPKKEITETARTDMRLHTEVRERNSPLSLKVNLTFRN